MFSCVYLYSCSNDSIYSCDKQIDNWVHENLSGIQKMSRAEWEELNEELKLPAYRAFNLKQRIDFWNEKLNAVLELEWSEGEMAHINSLIDFINEHQHFLNGYNFLSDDEKNEFDLFIYKWKDKAKMEYGWSDKLLYAFLASGNTLLDAEGTLSKTSALSKVEALAATESNCNCSRSSDWCTVTMHTCEETSCETVRGCGTLFIYDCDGRCEGI